MHDQLYNIHQIKFVTLARIYIEFWYSYCITSRGTHSRQLEQQCIVKVVVFAEHEVLNAGGGDQCLEAIQTDLDPSHLPLLDLRKELDKLPKMTPEREMLKYVK